MTLKKALENYEAQKAAYDAALAEFTTVDKKASKIIATAFHGAPLNECFRLAIQDNRFTETQRAVLTELEPIWRQRRAICHTEAPKVEKSERELAASYLDAISEHNDAVNTEARVLREQIVTAISDFGYEPSEVNKFADEAPKLVSIRNRFLKTPRSTEALLRCVRAFLRD